MQQINTTARNSKQSGFALLLTLITVTALVSIGLALLSVSTRQVRLSTVATDSEIAFSAANAGVECALYWRRLADSAAELETDGFFNPSCFGVSSIPVTLESNAQRGLTPVPDVTSATGEAYFYQFEFTWNSTSNVRCSKISMLVATSSVTDINPTVVSNVKSELLPGYPVSGDWSCDAGLQCTVIAAEGFNKACSDTDENGTVQREVLLEL
jgi:Tfp pilus assembly protein PilX